MTANWNTRMKGTGPYAQMMARRFHLAVKRLGLNQAHRPLAIHSFKRPPRLGDSYRSSKDGGMPHYIYEVASAEDHGRSRSAAWMKPGAAPWPGRWWRRR